jgi:predicted transcriptional regulator
VDILIESSNRKKERGEQRAYYEKITKELELSPTPGISWNFKSCGFP